jgi:hypothetical protein
MDYHIDRDWKVIGHYIFSWKLHIRLGEYTNCFRLVLETLDGQSGRLAFPTPPLLISGLTLG